MHGSPRLGPPGGSRQTRYNSPVNETKLVRTSWRVAEKNGIEQSHEMKAYEETCNMLRHYSNASLTVRLGSAAQGITLLGAWGIALAQKNSQLIILLPITGLLITALLYRFHLGYFRAVEFFYGLGEKMEETLFNNPDFRPISRYQQRHKKLYRHLWARIFTLLAPFTLTGTLFVIALVYSVWMLSCNTNK